MLLTRVSGYIGISFFLFLFVIQVASVSATTQKHTVSQNFVSQLLQSNASQANAVRTGLVRVSVNNPMLLSGQQVRAVKQGQLKVPSQMRLMSIQAGALGQARIVVPDQSGNILMTQLPQSQGLGEISSLLFDSTRSFFSF